MGKSFHLYGYLWTFFFFFFTSSVTHQASRHVPVASCEEQLAARDSSYGPRRALTPTRILHMLMFEVNGELNVSLCQ